MVQESKKEREKSKQVTGIFFIAQLTYMNKEESEIKHGTTKIYVPLK